MFKNFINLFTGGTGTNLPRIRTKKYSERDLLRKESIIGRDLFGPIPNGHQREFFCLDERTWIWYEKWVDETTKQPQELTTRYELHTNGIIKIQAGQPYRIIEGEELKNLVDAMELYRNRIANELYHCDPVTGRPLELATN